MIFYACIKIKLNHKTVSMQNIGVIWKFKIRKLFKKGYHFINFFGILKTINILLKIYLRKEESVMLFFLNGFAATSTPLSTNFLVGIAMEDADHPCIFIGGVLEKGKQSSLSLRTTLNAVWKRGEKLDIQVTHSSQNGGDI